MIETLHLAARRPENARTIASLMHAIDHFRRGRLDSVLSNAELGAITAPTTFILGSDDPYLSVEHARPSIQQIPAATLHEMPGGHAPWLFDPERAASLIATDPGRAASANQQDLAYTDGPVEASAMLTPRSGDKPVITHPAESSAAEA